MRAEFSRAVLEALIEEGHLSPDSRVMVACAGEWDQALFHVLGFTDVCFTNIDLESGTAPHGERIDMPGATGAEWRAADVHALPFADDSFDATFVSDGLHHCRAPHQAVTEMYRVGRRATIVIESRDSIAVRAAERAGATWSFEINGRLLTTRRQGGVDFGPVPNYVYRWTEREFEKLISSFDPGRRTAYEYFYGLHLPGQATGGRQLALRAAGALVTALSPRQGNTFAMAALKPPPGGSRSLQPFLEPGQDGPEVRGDIRTGDDVARVMRGFSGPPRRRHTIKHPERTHPWPAHLRPRSPEDI